MQDRFETFSTTIAYINRCVQKIKSKEMAAIGMRGNHTMCLYMLGKSPDGLSASQLCVKCGEDKAAISRTVKELMDMGCITSHTTDSKRTYRSRLLLTPKGNAVLAFIETRVNAALDSIGEGLNEAQRKAFYNSLELISGNLQAYMTRFEGETGGKNDE